MKLPFSLLIVLSALVLFQCTGPGAMPPAQTAQTIAINAEAAQTIACASPSDCAVKWQRAFVWIDRNSTYKIATRTETAIKTYGPLEPTTDPAFTVTKSGGPSSGATITFSSDCGAGAMCVPDAQELRASFTRYLTEGY